MQTPSKLSNACQVGAAGVGLAVALLGVLPIFLGAMAGGGEVGSARFVAGAAWLLAIVAIGACATWGALVGSRPLLAASCVALVAAAALNFTSPTFLLGLALAAMLAMLTMAVTPSNRLLAPPPARAAGQ